MFDFIIVVVVFGCVICSFVCFHCCSSIFIDTVVCVVVVDDDGNDDVLSLSPETDHEADAGFSLDVASFVFDDFFCLKS